MILPVWFINLSFSNFFRFVFLDHYCIPGSVNSSQTGKYVVWQKSNETYFLLMMKFILFTNQGYPLQNNTLGQLHSDGGVVSIVRSSDGRLLLVHLSACRLRSSGY